MFGFALPARAAPGCVLPARAAPDEAEPAANGRFGALFAVGGWISESLRPFERSQATDIAVLVAVTARSISAEQRGEWDTSPSSQTLHGHASSRVATSTYDIEILVGPRSCEPVRSPTAEV